MYAVFEIRFFLYAILRDRIYSDKEEVNPPYLCMHKSKWIVQTLILSGALNAALLCIFFYFLIRENPIDFSYSPHETVATTPLPLSFSFLDRLKAFSYQQLVEILEDERKLEHGYKVRDAALGALAAFHDFDVERALGRSGIARRKWVGERGVFILFSGLADKDFEGIISFAKMEKFPFTTQGLYKRIAQAGIEKSDPELLNLMCRSQPLALLQTLFARAPHPLQKKMILNLAIEGGWEALERFYTEQKRRSDFSPTARSKYLLAVLEKGSPTAASLLLSTDFNFAVKELEDKDVIKIFDSLKEKSAASLQYAEIIAKSPRSDRVRAKALSFFEKNQGDLAGHFIEKPGLKDLRPVFRQAPPAAPPPGTHVVQPGESLWLIARKYGLTIESLMEMNHLQTTVIQPGKVLKIPA